MTDQTAELEPQEFSRYEFKYLLPLRLRETVENEVRYFMQTDQNVDPALDDQYLVRSLYFDSTMADNFYEKIDGIKTRRKYRIRTYVDRALDHSPVFLEVKGRHNERTYKERIAVNWGDVPLLLASDRWTTLVKRSVGQPLMEAFAFDVRRKQNRAAPRRTPRIAHCCFRLFAGSDRRHSFFTVFGRRRSPSKSRRLKQITRLVT